MVLPEGIELSTSPLPRECSTTELRQPGRHQGIGNLHPEKASAPTKPTRMEPVPASGADTATRLDEGQDRKPSSPR